MHPECYYFGRGERGQIGGTSMRRWLIAVVVVVALVAAGCDWQKVVPPGDAPLR
jgi:hypothetical protein